MAELNAMELERVRNLIDASKRDTYERLMDVRKTALDLQGHYGKWLISSLLLIHGAAIGFICQSERLSQKLIPEVFFAAVLGLGLALLCGFLTWINWGLNYRVYNSVDPGMVIDNQFWPNLHAHKSNFWVKVTFLLSIAAGLASVACMAYGSIATARILGPGP